MLFNSMIREKSYHILHILFKTNYFNKWEGRDNYLSQESYLLINVIHLQNKTGIAWLSSVSACEVYG